MSMIYRTDPEFMAEAGPRVPVRIEGRTLLALISTGTRRSYVDQDTARRMGLVRTGTHRLEHGTEFPVFAARLEVPALGITLPGPLRGLPLQASGTAWPVVLGQDALENASLEVDGPAGTVELSPASGKERR